MSKGKKIKEIQIYLQLKFKSLSNTMSNENLKMEKEFLNEKCKTYRESLYHRTKREFIIKTFNYYLTKFKNVSNREIGLQLGCSSDGWETEILSKILNKLDVIEGSSEFIERCKKKDLKNVRFINCLFEEFQVNNEEEKYNFVFCTYVLEHVLDIESILNMIKSVLKPKGLLFVVVPNCRGFSRQLALHMNLIPDLKELTQNDLNHGHRRSFDRFSLNKYLTKCGFNIIHQGGIIFKILADFQLDKLLEDGFLNEAHIEGLYKLGFEYPDFADSLFAICCTKDE